MRNSTQPTNEHRPLWRRVLRKLVVGFYVLFALGLGGCAYALFFIGRPPAPRPDLVSIPVEGIPPPSPGYPTTYTAYALLGFGYYLGLNDLIDPRLPMPLPDGVKKTAEIAYVPGTPELLLDLFEPTTPSDTPRPALLFVHGGSFRRGERHWGDMYCIEFARRGFVTATVDYRLAPEHTFPQPLQDVRAAIGYLRTHAEALNIDPERLVLMGQSAGGHLALLAAYSDFDYPDPRWDRPANLDLRPNLVVGLYPPSDLTWEEPRDHPIVYEFLGARYADRPDLYEEASPLMQVSPDDPPTLIIHGTTDSWVPIGQSDALVERLREVGVPAWYDRIDGWPHALDVYPENFTHVQELMSAFFQQELVARTRLTQNGHD